LKGHLKAWNKDVFGNLNRKKEQIIAAITTLDLDDENNILQQEGRLKR